MNWRYDMRLYAGAFLALCLLVAFALFEMGHTAVATVAMFLALFLAALSALALLLVWVFSKEWAP